MQTHPPGYVPIEILAKYLHVSVWTVRAWLRHGYIPAHTYIKLGKAGQYRFSIPDVINALRGADSAQVASTVGPTVNPDQLNLDLDNTNDL